MKDTEARRRLDKIEMGLKDTAVRGRLDKIEAEFKEQVNCSLRNLVLDECPKCKHITLNEKVKRWSLTRVWVPFYRPTTVEYTCLTCGTKWEKDSKTVKRIIKKKK